MTTTNNFAAQASDEPMPFPPMPLPVVKHAVVGDLFDCFAMQQYALRYADLVVAALKAQPAPTEAQCEHRVADIRNPIVKSGYMCIDCGTLFAAADHGKAPAQVAQGEDSARLAQDCIESIASGQTWDDSYQSAHCSTCSADLDDGENHKDDCLTIRAQSFLARASAEKGGVKS